MQFALYYELNRDTSKYGCKKICKIYYSEGKYYFYVENIKMSNKTFTYEIGN